MQTQDDHTQMPGLRFGSVCSGIEAASVAWHPLGWKAAWLSEIEPFPSAVLAHHYPDVPNLGDMTTLPERIRSGEVEAPDLFCGGTPCQAFSVAGLRKSLDDARGNLSLVFCEIANAIDSARAGRNQPPAIVFWENVPGVLSTKDNAFGCFLAGLAGEETPLEPTGGKWTNAGVVLGPQRAVAWRILDAQYFGVAQRRRRVFVVASARDGFDPASVLLEFDGVRRDSAPSREAGKVAPTIPSRSTAGGGLGTDFDLDGGVIRQPVAARMVSFGEYVDDGTASAMKARDYKDATDLVAGPAYGIRTANTSSNGWGIQEEVTHTLDTTQGVAVAQPIPMVNMQGSKGNAVAQEDGPSFTLNAMHGHDVHAIAVPVQPIAFHPTQDPICSEDGTTHCMGTGSSQGNATVAVAHPIAFSAKDYGGDASADLSPTLRAMNHADSHANGGGQMAVAQPIPFDTTQITSPANYSKPQAGDPCHPLAAGAHPPAIAWDEELNPSVEVAGTLLRGGAGGRHDGVMQPIGAFFAGQGAKAGSIAYSDTVAPTLKAGDSGTNRTPSAHVGMAVRRLTPRECEALQGFPQDYTAIPWRKKPADECPDGPRYKALGNSWAVPVVRWIGTRIQARLSNPAAHIFSPDSKLSLHQQT